ncbi:MAG TPA: hypothetical protein VG652_11610 [Gaiellaceae bacterium]|nr:hypothetical protein [Gaiellaceae bacterium]
MVSLISCIGASVAAATIAPKSKHIVVPKNTKLCPIAEANGVLGASSGGFAGGTPLGKNASGMLTLDCGYIAQKLKITIPGHQLAAAKPPFVGTSCTVKGDAITCDLNTAEQREGISVAGAWENTFIWTFKSTDPVATNTRTGTCGLKVKITVMAAGTSNLTKATHTVCAYAYGDALE